MKKAEIEMLANELIEACGDTADHQSRWQIRDRLVKAGKPAVPAILRLLGDSSVGVRAIAVEVLGRIGDPSAAPALERLMEDDPNTDVQGLAAEALARLHSNHALGSMLRALNTPDKGKRMDLVRALTRLRNPSAVPALSELARRLESNGEQSIAGQVQAGISYIEGGIENLQAILTNASLSIELRRGAAAMLDESSRPDAIPVLLRCLHDEDEPLRNKALQSLGNLHFELKPVEPGLAKAMVKELMRTLIDDPSDRIRMQAADQLRVLGDPEALPALERAARYDTDSFTRDISAEAVRKLRRLGNRN